MQTIVIDREYGSGGREVARCLSEKLSIPFYDGDMLIEAAKLSHIDLSKMKDFDEKRVGSLLYNVAMVAGSIRNSNQLETPHQVYGALERLMKQLVAKGPCIFLGRCAGQILCETTSLLRVFIYSGDEEARAKRIAKLDSIPLSQAKGELHKKDTQRANYYRFFTDKQWGDKANYEICLNTEKLSCSACADAIQCLLVKE